MNSEEMQKKYFHRRVAVSVVLAVSTFLIVTAISHLINEVLL